MIDPIYWMHGTLGALIIGCFGAIWRKLRRMHKVMLQWNGHKVEYDKQNK